MTSVFSYRGLNSTEAGDTPVVGDFAGDARSDHAVATTVLAEFPHGIAGDIPLGRTIRSSWIDAGRLRVHVDGVFPFDEIARAPAARGG